MIKLTPEKPPYYENVAPTKIYKALISQLGTANPTLTIIHNTIGNIIWTRTGAGTYIATLAGAFPILKTYLQKTEGLCFIAFENEENNEPSDTLRLNTWNTAGAPTDELLYYTPITITIYP